MEERPLEQRRCVIGAELGFSVQALEITARQGPIYCSHCPDKFRDPEAYHGKIGAVSGRLIRTRPPRETEANTNAWAWTPQRLSRGKLQI